jgi:hypothetical protein
MTLLIVDADHLTWRSSSSCSPTKNKPYQEDLNVALWRLDASVEALRLAYNDPTFEFYISGEGNWRYDIYPEYKANRKEVVKPLWLEECRERLVVQYKAQVVNGREVDDMCGIRLSQCSKLDVADKVVCASLDKDLRQVPGYHYRWETRYMGSIKPGEEVLVSPLDGLRTFYKQIITGDQADHVPAFDGAFRSSLPKFVAKLLEPIDEMTDEKDMWEYVLSVYGANQGTQESDYAFKDAKRNAQVLYVQRTWEDMWQPPSSFLEVI